MTTFAEALRAKGRVEGQRRLLLRLLCARFGEVPGDASIHVEQATEPELEELGRRFLLATTLEEILAECSPLYPSTLPASAGTRNILAPLLSIFQGESDARTRAACETVGEQFCMAGCAEGQRELLLSLARVRFDEPAAKIEARLAGAISAMLETLGERVATAKTLDEVFAE